MYPQAGPPSFSPANDSFLSVQHDNVLITAKKADYNQPTLVYFPDSLDTLAEKLSLVPAAIAQAEEG